MSLNTEDRRKLIRTYCANNPSQPKNKIFHYFSAMGFKKTFIYNVISDVQSGKKMD